MRRIDEGKVCVLTRGDLETGRGEKNSLDNPCGDVWLNLKKSAEVIVLTETVRKDRTVTNFSSEGRWGNA
jgi:hypothetical protein